jgi:hypothetical protein
MDDFDGIEKVLKLLFPVLLLELGSKEVIELRDGDLNLFKIEFSGILEDEIIYQLIT